MTLDFRALQKPCIEITLLDDDNTVLHVETPTHGVLMRLQSMRKEAISLKGKNDPDTLAKMYDLLAELMSFNREGIKLTGTELREKYRLEQYHLLAFEMTYLDFINEVKSAKN